MKLVPVYLLLVACSAIVRADERFDPEPVVALFELVAENTDDPQAARECLSVLAEKVQTGELSADAIRALRVRLQPALVKIQDTSDHPLLVDAIILRASWKDSEGIAAAQVIFASEKSNDDQRLKALRALVAAGDKSVVTTVSRLLADTKTTKAPFRDAALAALGRSDSPQVADIVLTVYAKLEVESQPKAIELLTQRPAWAKSLLTAIGRGELPTTVLNANQVARLQKSRDDELVKLVQSKWGTVRTERNPERERVVADIRALIRRTPGDAFRGELVFKKLCAQCHKIHGEGQEVGPDLTSNGRSSFDQLLSNVFDPSLVIGGAYQQRTVVDNDGRSVSGLLVEDSQQRVVLKLQGGKTETIARENILEMTTSELSMMPEDVEKQFQPQEIADLFAFLTLDKHPRDPTAKQLPGVRE